MLPAGSPQQDGQGAVLPLAPAGGGVGQGKDM